MHARLTGIFPPIPTTFTASGDVDGEAIRANVRAWMGTRLSGILALGSNGEAGLLDEAESDLVVEAARDATPDDRVLIVGTGRESTRATIAASRRAAKLGATAVLVRTPSFFKAQMNTEALVAHFTAVADASPVPTLLYNLPGPTGIALTPAVVEPLADHPNVIGLKETSPDLERLIAFAGMRPNRFAVLVGWAPVLYPALMAGASGGILAVANVVPDMCVDVVDLASAGLHAEARALAQRLTPLAQLVTTVHGVAGLKAALDVVGLKGGPVRAPLLPASPSARAAIAQAIHDLRKD